MVNSTLAKLKFKSIQYYKAYVKKEKGAISALEWIEANKNKDLRLDYAFEDSAIIFDCGGYKGDYCSDLLECNSSMNIYVFELIDGYTDIIRARFRNNPNVKIFDFGLGNRNHEIPIEVNELHSSVYTNSENITTEIGQIKELNPFMHEQKIDCVDLIKLNIEGGEYDLLEYMIDTGSIREISVGLNRTHKVTWSYDWIFENWELKS